MWSSGVSLLEGGASLTLLVAILACNLPEALGGGDSRPGPYAGLRGPRLGGNGPAPDCLRGRRQWRTLGGERGLLAFLLAFAGGAGFLLSFIIEKS